MTEMKETKKVVFSLIIINRWGLAREKKMVKMRKEKGVLKYSSEKRLGAVIL